MFYGNAFSCEELVRQQPLGRVGFGNDLLIVRSKATFYTNGELLSYHQVSMWMSDYIPLQWRHNGRDSVSTHQPHDCLLNRLFRRRSKKTSKLRVTGLCVGNSPGTGEFPAQMASNAENVSIWWRHHAKENSGCDIYALILVNLC